MITVTNDFKTEANKPSKQWHAYITDQTMYPDEITDVDDLKSVKITAESSLLRTVMRQLDAQFFGSHDYLDEYISVGMGLQLPDNSTEYIDYGSFKVTSQEFDKAIDGVRIKGYDKMYEALQAYDLDPIYEIPAPFTLLELLEAICTRLEWTLSSGSTTFPNYDISFESDPVSGIGYTFRQVLDKIAEAAGSIIYFDVNDELVVKQIAHDTPLADLDADILQTLKVENKWGEVNSVVLSRMPQEDNILEKDQTSIDTNGLTEIKIENNELVDEDRETYVQPIFDELFGLEYYPFKATTNGLGYIQIGDRLTVTDPTEVSREVVVFTVILDLTGGMKETLEAKSPDKSSTNYNTAGILGMKIKNTEIIVNKQTGEITIITSNLNEAVAQINLSIDTITSSVNSAINQGDVNADAIADLQENLAELTLTAEALEVAVSGIGGTNLLKNSVGLKGSIAEWQVLDSNGNPVDADNNGTIDQSTDVINNSESGSAIRLDEQFIQQTFATIQGETYTIYFRYKSNDTCKLSVTGLTDITLPAAADWTVYKQQFLGSASTTTVKFDNTAEGASAYIILTDTIVKLGDASGWMQAPNEVYGANFRFDKDGFLLTDPTSKFKAILTNESLTVYDTSSGSDRIVMQVSKDLGKITKLTAQDQFVVQRYENSASSMRMIPVEGGVFLVIND